MKIQRYLKPALLALAASALVHSTSMAQITSSYTNTFDAGGNTTPFTGGSVASWIYWYGLGYGNTPMTNDPTMDAGNDPTSGSLQVYAPFGSAGDQAVFFGTFDNASPYDFSETIALNIITNIGFDIRVAPGTMTNSSGNFGNITYALMDGDSGGGNYGLWTSITIPAAAANGWVHLTDTNLAHDIANLESAGSTTVSAIGFDYNSYGGYPTFPVEFWIDNAAVTVSTAPAPPPPPPVINVPQLLMPGLDLIAVDNAQYDRYSVATANGTGYSFVGQPSVTYSWTITSFPGQAYSGFQQHFFIVSGSGTATVNTESAADYSETNVVFITVQYEPITTNTYVTNGLTITTNSATNWMGVMDFRYKTNEANGNAMLFNTAVSNANDFPVEPLGFVYGPSALGTWSVTFQDDTNITLRGPTGSTTNFTWSEASAQEFADPVYLFLGAQPNQVNAYGQIAVLSNFSVTGNQTPFTDNFVDDANNGSLNGNFVVDSANANGVQLIPSTSTNYLVTWSLPNVGFDLQATESLSDTNWVYLTGLYSGNPLTTFHDGANTAVLVPFPVAGTTGTMTNQVYFRLRNDGMYGQ